MGNCAKCGKELNFFECHNYWNNQIKNKGYLDFAKIFMSNTKHCIQVPEFKGKNLCLDCATDIYFGQQFKDALQQSKRQVVVQDVVQSADGLSKHMESVSSVAEKYGYLFKQETHVLGNYGFGARVITLTMVFEKAITTANETNFVKCDYCTTRYDANQYFKCPKCGSPAAIPEATTRELTTKENKPPIKLDNFCIAEENVEEEELTTKEEKYIDKMLRKGYVLNAETGKWEKPNY
jgi:hypothetical protein